MLVSLFALVAVSYLVNGILRAPYPFSDEVYWKDDWVPLANLKPETKAFFEEFYLGNSTIRACHIVAIRDASFPLDEFQLVWTLPENTATELALNIVAFREPLPARVTTESLLERCYYSYSDEMDHALRGMLQQGTLSPVRYRELMKVVNRKLQVEGPRKSGSLHLGDQERLSPAEVNVPVTPVASLSTHEGEKTSFEPKFDSVLSGEL